LKKIVFFLNLILFIKSFAANPFADKHSLETDISYLPSTNFKTKTLNFEILSILGRKWEYKWTQTFSFNYRNTTDSKYFPVDLYQIRYSLSGENEKNWLKFNVNTNSDIPFYSIDTINFGFNGGWTFWQKRNHSLIFGLFYRFISPFLGGLPIPFVYYKYQSKNVYLLFPFVFRYQINKTNSFLLTYFPVRNIKISYKYSPIRPFVISFEGEIKLYTYYLAHRKNKDELLFYERKIIGIRPSFFISRKFMLSGFVGYSFNGKYYKGESYDNFLDLEKVNNSIFVKIGGKYYF
jgi:hypothetical protein